MASRRGAREDRDEPEYDDASPRAPALIESLRAFGYSLETAVADLVDNSITAGAKNVWITCHWSGEKSWISIRDDGSGMTAPELIEAMRPGTRGPTAPREPSDLGRFGLGLKTATFSQCRLLTLRTRKRGGACVTRRWDLDYVGQTGEWRLLREAAEESEPHLPTADDLGVGTVVLWEQLDRVVPGMKTDNRKDQGRFNELVLDVKAHLGMVFHRYLDGSAGRRLKIKVNGQSVEAWDPFRKSHETTLALGEETLDPSGARITVQPYVLPHLSRLDDDEKKLAEGPGGWNARQGFYVYRNARLLVPGDWLGLGFKREEHHKLARIQLDLPNSVDATWEIDVKKSRATPPAVLRVDLQRIAKIARERSAAIYRHRGKIITRTRDSDPVVLWLRKVHRRKVRYVINREHPLVVAVLDAARRKDEAEALMRMIEETVPVPTIAIDTAEQPDELARPLEGAPDAEVEALMKVVFKSLIDSGVDVDSARTRLAGMEPFDAYPAVIAALPAPARRSDRRA